MAHFFFLQEHGILPFVCNAGKHATKCRMRTTFKYPPSALSLPSSDPLTSNDELLLAGSLYIDLHFFRQHGMACCFNSVYYACLLSPLLFQSYS